MFPFRGDVFALATVPTGAVFPPLFAQALSRAVLLLAIRASDTTAYVSCDCLIDNLRITSDNLHALWCTWHEILHLSRRLGATIGDMCPPPVGIPRPYVYLGMQFDLTDGAPCVALAPKSKAKISDAILKITSGASLSVIEVLSLFGLTVWACTVTGYKLGRLYHVLKFARGRQKMPLQAETKIWRSIRGKWAQALVEMASTH